MNSFIPSTIRRYRNQRRLNLENVSGIAGMSVQHLSEIESSKRDPRLSSIERIADAMELAVMLVPEHMYSLVKTCATGFPGTTMLARLLVIVPFTPRGFKI